MLRSAVVTLLLVVWSSQTAWGQYIRGRLLDLETNEPIPTGLVTLIADDGERVMTSVTSGDGRYRLRAPRPGSYYVEAKRLGYRIWIDGPIQLRRGDDWQTTYHLRPVAVALDPVEVSAAAAELNRRHLRSVGFFERQKSDFGHFITRDRIEKRAANLVSDLLAAVPGVTLAPQARGLGRVRVRLRGSFNPDGSPCHPRVFVDGIIAIRGESRPAGVDIYGRPEFATEAGELQESEYLEPAIDDVVDPDDIEAIEVYRSASQVPARFGGTSISTHCGVIVIWTRFGRRGG